MKPNSASLKFNLVLAHLFFLGLTLASCGGGGGDGDNGPLASQGEVCGSIGYSATAKVAGGEQCIANSASDTSSVVRLTIITRDGSTGTCTGTVISSRAVLTAGHCLLVSDSQSITVTAVSNGAKVSIPAARTAIHPGFSVSSESVFFNDVGIVITDRPLPVPPLPILLSRAPAVDESSIVAGYGQSESEGSSVDDVIAGEAIIRLVTDNHLRIDFRGGESHPCRGDSGGALFVKEGDSLAIVGVVSQSDPSVSSDQVCKKGDSTLYTNTQQSSVSAFIFAQARGASVR